MSIPVEAKSFTFTPDCLVGKEGAPTFTLRYGTRRDRHAYQDEASLKGLKNHSDEDFRAANIDEIKLKWAGDGIDIAEVVDAVERYYAALDIMSGANDEWIKIVESVVKDIPEDQRDTPETRAMLPAAPIFEFDSIEQEKVENLLDDVEASSTRIGRMRRDNTRREREIRRISIAILLQATSLDLTLSRTIEGILTDDCVDKIQNALEKFSEDAGLSGAEVREAFADLCGRSLMAQFGLTKAEEKNSSSPVLITSDQNGLTESDDKPSTSKTSAKSPTQEPSSPTPTSESSRLPSPVETDLVASDGLTEEPISTNP